MRATRPPRWHTVWFPAIRAFPNVTPIPLSDHDSPMRILAVHPSSLLYTKIFLRLEPLGIELIAAELRREGHEVRLIDLQVERHDDFFRMLREWRPDVVAFSVNYLANIPEVIDLAKATKRQSPGAFVFVGGHSASFVAAELLDHAQGVDRLRAQGGSRVFGRPAGERGRRSRSAGAAGGTRFGHAGGSRPVSPVQPQSRRPSPCP